MALVNYESSDDDEDGVNSPAISSNSTVAQGLKRKRTSSRSTVVDLPPLPSRFLDLYASTARVSTRDDPSLHGGRKRITPHVEGNWPSHIYIEWYPSMAEYEMLASLTAFIQDEKAGTSGQSKLQSLLISDLGTPLPLHISLSRPITFTSDQKDSFLQSLHDDVKRSRIRPFDLTLSGLDWVPNSEKTRWFLVLQVRIGDNGELNSLLGVCNAIVKNFSQPALYVQPPNHISGNFEDSRRTATTEEIDSNFMAERRTAKDVPNPFHISIGWTLEQPTIDIISTSTSTSDEHILGNITINVDTIKAKIGNVVTSISLPLKAIEGKSLFKLQ